MKYDRVASGGLGSNEDSAQTAAAAAFSPRSLIKYDPKSVVGSPGRGHAPASFPFPLFVLFPLPDPPPLLPQWPERPIPFWSLERKETKS